MEPPPSAEGRIFTNLEEFMAQNPLPPSVPYEMYRQVLNDLDTTRTAFFRLIHIFLCPEGTDVVRAATTLIALGCALKRS